MLRIPRTRSLLASSDSGMHRGIWAWTRTDLIEKCGRGSRTFRSVRKVSRSTGLNSMRGRRTMFGATGATWLHPKGASHGEM